MIESSTFEKELAVHGRFMYKNVGTSMMPLIREGKDVMIIERPNGRLRKYDVALYKKNGSYILHRVIKVRESDYVIVGDHCTVREYGITDSDIIGVMKGLIRSGKELDLNSFGYKFYYHLWCDLYPVRVFIIKMKSFARRALRKVFLKRDK
jgi:hypothetical protein